MHLLTFQNKISTSTIIPGKSLYIFKNMNSKKIGMWRVVFGDLKKLHCLLSKACLGQKAHKKSGLQLQRNYSDPKILNHLLLVQLLCDLQSSSTWLPKQPVTSIWSNFWHNLKFMEPANIFQLCCSYAFSKIVLV